MRIGLGRRPWLNPRLSVSMSRSAKLVLFPGTSMCAHVRVKGWIHNAAAHRVFCHFLSPFGFFKTKNSLLSSLISTVKTPARVSGVYGKIERWKNSAKKDPQVEEFKLISQRKKAAPIWGW